MPTESKPRIIVDTNVIISGILFKGQTVRTALTLAVDRHQLVFSEQTWDELALVLQRSDFEKYMPLDARLTILASLAGEVDVVASHTVVMDCRDPKDNKFLALAKDSGATLIVSGDKDLTDLHPYQGIAIYSPARFIKTIILEDCRS